MGRLGFVGWSAKIGSVLFVMVYAAAFILGLVLGVMGNFWLHIVNPIEYLVPLLGEIVHITAFFLFIRVLLLDSEKLDKIKLSFVIGMVLFGAGLFLG